MYQELIDQIHKLSDDCSDDKAMSDVKTLIGTYESKYAELEKRAENELNEVQSSSIKSIINFNKTNKFNSIKTIWMKEYGEIFGEESGCMEKQNLKKVKLLIVFFQIIQTKFFYKRSHFCCS